MRFLGYIPCLTTGLMIQFVLANNCGPPSTINFDDYVDIIQAQTFSTLPGWNASLAESEQVYPRNNRYLYRHGTRCHHGNRAQLVGTIDYRSPCPVKWIVNEDSERIPRQLSHAVCLCESPRQIFGGSHGYRCHSVVQYVAVYRLDGCTYKRVWEPLPVSCIAISIPEASSSTLARIAIRQ